MKKLRLIVFVLLVVFCFSACAGGNVAQVQRLVGPSEQYTEREIESAMDTVTRHFRKEFRGCTLTKLTYSEDAAAAEAWAEQYQADEAVVLRSEFEVGASGGDGSLNPNSTYTGWQWVLTRSNGGIWELKTWGYG